MSTQLQSGTERIAAAFAGSGKRAALMPYLMGGYPTLERSLQIGRACIEAGADLIELGMPYSDPLADGPVIHAAGTEALAAGANVVGVLEVARGLAREVPVVLMCYVNMVLAPGAEAFVARLAQTGVCGLIVPDLPLEESGEIAAVCERYGLALVPLIAPTTTPARMSAIGALAKGFLYAVSVVGTTGERGGGAQADSGMGAKRVSPESAERYAEIVARAKASTEVPVALGFGIGTPSQARMAADAGADGVIVGTRLVRAAREDPEHPAGAVGAVVNELAGALVR